MYGSTLAGPSSRSTSKSRDTSSPTRDAITTDTDTDSCESDSCAEAAGELEHPASERSPLLPSRGLAEKQPLGWVGGRLGRNLTELKVKGPTLVLENSGSVARDHLASERTFLAYLRTSLAIASAGVGLVQLFTLAAESSPQLVPLARPIGGIVILMALFTLFYGTNRFFIVQSALVNGKYPVARVSPTVVALGLGGVVFLVFGVLIGTRG